MSTDDPRSLPGATPFTEGRRNFPLDELIPYAGRYIAWSLDGKRILASGVDMDEMEANLQADGIDPSLVVSEFIPPLDHGPYF